jgi:hypothetical protein
MGTVAACLHAHQATECLSPRQDSQLASSLCMMPDDLCKHRERRAILAGTECAQTASSKHLMSLSMALCGTAGQPVAAVP